MSFIEIVDKILTITKDSDYSENPTKKAKVRDYEKHPISSLMVSYGARIDQLVYKLYGLTAEEIKIVED